MEGESETYKLVYYWSIALVSLLYCHTIGMFIAQGTTRFLAIFPVILFFLYLPSNLHAIFFCGLSAFFLSWLGTFKLVLYAFGQGPLSSYPTLPFSHFICTVCLPIKFIRNQENPSHQFTKKTQRSPKDYASRVFIFLVTLKAYYYKEKLHPLLITSIHAYYIFFSVELLLALGACLARNVAQAELEPQFNEPYRATSVQNFWGKRCNLMVSSILRSTVYHPARVVFSHVVQERWVSVPAVFVTFIVSGIMHEMIYYYLGRLKPTWEVTWFFVIHGAWVGTEIVIKKTTGQRFALPAVVSRALTLAFVMITTSWLFLPPFIRVDPFARFCREVFAFSGSLRHGRLISPDDYTCPYF